MVLAGVAASPVFALMIDQGPWRSSTTTFARAAATRSPCRTALDAIADLHALLRAAGVPGSYVFACHSLGGPFVRHYASIYPRDILGLVLVDADSEALETLLRPER
jgi:pimeloyl-ACP methyl ester carboxylesterase